MTWTPEVPGAIVIPADPSRYRERPQGVIRGNGYGRIVTHGTSGHPDPRGTAGMWQKPASPGDGASSHFIIGEPQLGQIIVVQAVPLRFAAQHAHRDVNPDSVGVEHCIRAPKTLDPDDPGFPPSEALYDASAQLQAYLLKAGGYVIDRSLTIVGHAEVDQYTTHTACPIGDGWDWSVFVPKLQAAFDAIGGPPSVG